MSDTIAEAEVVAAVSVQESEPLKMQDPFKEYVKLSRLKIYVPCVYEGQGCLCSLGATAKAANAWSRDTQTDASMRAASRTHTRPRDNGGGVFRKLDFFLLW